MTEQTVSRRFGTGGILLCLHYAAPMLCLQTSRLCKPKQTFCFFFFFLMLFDLRAFGSACVRARFGSRLL